jgi:hypothetical protein
MGQHRPGVALVLLLAVAVAACGGVAPSAAPPTVASAAPTAVSRPTPPSVPGSAPTTPVPGGGTAATIRVEPGVEADGPGASISDALANAGIGPQLVNGILLRAVDGTVWLCEAVLTSSPPRCAEPSLLVVNRPQDQTFVDGDGLHEAEGVRWVENAQLFGTVRP